MLGVNWREVALVTLAVTFVFGSVIGGFYLPRPYRDTLLDVWHVATIIVVAFLIVRWFIRRKRRN